MPDVHDIGPFQSLSNIPPKSFFYVCVLSCAAFPIQPLSSFHARNTTYTLLVSQPQSTHILYNEHHNRKMTLYSAALEKER